ncbi:MAG: GAF domain-containing protein [Micromonosporaceae bacterium]|nr:GAF domain-containing protein [Micromonosporaceae bacterium]
MLDLSTWIVRHFRPVAISCAVAAFALGSVLTLVQGSPLFWSLLTVAAVLTAGAVGVPMYAEHLASIRAVDAELAAESAKQQMRLVVGRVLTPLAYLLGEITDAKPRSNVLERLQGQALQVVLAAATELVDAEAARACFFRLVEGRQRRLELAGYYGRAQPATWILAESTPLGDGALLILESGATAFFPDLTVEAPPGWVDDEHRHRALVVVPISTEQREFGLLTVDTLESGTLTEQDAEVAQLLGELLSAGFNR